MKKWVFGAAVAAIAGAALAQRERLPENCRQQIMQLCQMGGGVRECVRTALPKLSDDCRKAISDRAAGRNQRPPGMTEIAYGTDAKQRLDLMAPPAAGIGKAGAPVLFFVHGGGWSIGDKAMGASTKGPWATGLGWAYVSANYRLVPQATVEQQAADLANALAWLRANATARGLDPDRIVLMGHSAGAHLVALLGTDSRYLKAAGVPLSAIRGVVLLDGAGYDVPAQASAERNIVKPMYEAAFSSDPKRQAALSPMTYAAAPNASAWLILPVARRADSRAQSQKLADALMKAGASANVTPIEGESHATLNRGLGEAGDTATRYVEDFLKGLRS
jgi:arylformamidase